MRANRKADLSQLTSAFRACASRPIPSTHLRAFSQSTSIVTREQNQSLASIPTGTGGRNSSTGKNITIFGATGFVGRYLVNELGRHGNTMIIPTHGDDMGWRHLKPLTDYGKLAPCYFNLRDESSIRKAIDGADVVINLQGKHYQTKHFYPWIINWSFEDLHVQGAKRLARISRECNVKHFVQLSTTAINTQNSTSKPNLMSKWVDSKKRGDEAVLKEFPGAVIVKSNVIYGEEDRLLNWYARQMQGYPFGIVPLVNGGSARVQPVFVGDIADALCLIASNYDTCAKTYALHGPHEYSYKEIAEYCAEQVHYLGKMKLLDVPERLMQMAGKIVDNLPIPRPFYTEDMVQVLKMDQTEELDGDYDLGFGSLGLKPENFEKKAFNFLYKYRLGGHFAEPKSAHVTHS